MAQSIDRPFLLIAAVSLLFNSIAWGMTLFFPRHESAAILHYTSAVGIDFVGEGRHIIVLPAVGTVVLLLNLIVGRLIVKADQRTAWVLWSGVPIIEVLLIIALAFLKNLNR
jgi:hypothetical protein